METKTYPCYLDLMGIPYGVNMESPSTPFTHEIEFIVKEINNDKTK